MHLDPLMLFSSFKERILFCSFLLIVFLVNISMSYMDYVCFKKEEFIKLDAKVVNLYPKGEYNVVQFKADNFRFFTTVSHDTVIQKQSTFSLVILSHGIHFMDFMQGFFTKSFLYEKRNQGDFKSLLYYRIQVQHESDVLKELFSALFLAIPLNTDLRAYFAVLSISHLIAISGFHLSVLSGCLYVIFGFIYKPIHQRFFLWRNRRIDVMITCSVILFLYLLLTDIVPSLLRAFIMFIVALYLLRQHIKVVSYETLLYCFLLIMALFPSYIFSLGLWFSFAAVFYIFLFVQYFKKGNKWFLIFLFNFWIFLVFNPIVHFFFEQTSPFQFLSPFLTLLFTLFYPLELLLHLVGQADILDQYLMVLLSYDIESFERWTPLWFLILYVCFSFLSIMKKEAFYMLNVLMIGFNVYLYV